MKLTLVGRWIDCPRRDLLQPGGKKAKQFFLERFAQKVETDFNVVYFPRKSCEIRRSLIQHLSF